MREEVSVVVGVDLAILVGRIEPLAVGSPTPVVHGVHTDVTAGVIIAAAMQQSIFVENCSDIAGTVRQSGLDQHVVYVSGVRIGHLNDRNLAHRSADQRPTICSLTSTSGPCRLFSNFTHHLSPSASRI